VERRGRTIEEEMEMGTEAKRPLHDESRIRALVFLVNHL